MANTEKKRKTPLRGTTHCKKCLWYIGNNMLNDRNHICPNCDNNMKEKK
jgi:hypothetical protein